MYPFDPQNPLVGFLSSIFSEPHQKTPSFDSRLESVNICGFIKIGGTLVAVHSFSLVICLSCSTRYPLDHTMGVVYMDYKKERERMECFEFDSVYGERLPTDATTRLLAAPARQRDNMTCLSATIGDSIFGHFSCSSLNRKEGAKKRRRFKEMAIWCRIAT